MTFDIIAPDKCSRPLPGAPQQQTEFHIIKNREPQRFVAPAFAIRRHAHQIEGAQTKIMFRPIAIHAGNPVRHGHEKRQVPCPAPGRFRRHPGRERDVVGVFAFRHPQRARDHVRLEPAIGVREQNPITRSQAGANMAGMALPKPAFGQRVDPLYRHARVLLRQPAQNLARSVLRAVVHGDDFQSGTLLRQQTANGGFDPRLLITRCQNDRTQAALVFPNRL